MPHPAEVSAESMVLSTHPESTSDRRGLSAPAGNGGLLTDVEWDSMSNRIGPGRFPGIRSPLKSLVWLVRVIVGVVFLIGLLATLAAVPGLSLLTLGFMLAAEAGLARSGSLRHAFPLLPVSTRIGTILILVGLFLLPLRLLASLAAAHGVIAQSSPLAPNPQHTVLVVLQVLVFVHMITAIACGGSLACFVRPIRNIRRLAIGLRDGSWKESLNHWSTWLLSVFRPCEHLVLAVKATVGAVIWLFIPTALLAASSRPQTDPGFPGLLSFVGGILLIPVASWLPLLQVHQAVTGRFRDIFDVRTVRRIIRQVPVHWAIAAVLLYAAAIPLYLTKVRLIADDAVWLLTPLFVILIYPARLMFGWVYARGMRRPDPTTRLIRWPVKLVMIPVLGAYALILFATPLISEAGQAALFENHAFLLPIPGQLFGS